MDKVFANEQLTHIRKKPSLAYFMGELATSLGGAAIALGVYGHAWACFCGCVMQFIALLIYMKLTSASLPSSD
jgi:hypothetical protein